MCDEAYSGKFLSGKCRQFQCGVVEPQAACTGIGHAETVVETPLITVSVACHEDVGKGETEEKDCVTDSSSGSMPEPDMLNVSLLNLPSSMVTGEDRLTLLVMVLVSDETVRVASPS